MFHSHWFTAGPANELLSRTPRVPNPDCRTGQVPPGSWWRRDLQGPEKSVTSVGVRRSFYIASDSHPKAMNSDPRERVSRSRTCHIQVLQQLKIEFGVAIVPFVRSTESSSMIPISGGSGMPSRLVIPRVVKLKPLLSPEPPSISCCMIFYLALLSPERPRLVTCSQSR